jgi:hypothetical protein
MCMCVYVCVYVCMCVRVYVYDGNVMAKNDCFMFNIMGT